jgi:hypothetical protein
VETLRHRQNVPGFERLAHQRALFLTELFDLLDQVLKLLEVVLLVAASLRVIWLTCLIQSSFCEPPHFRLLPVESLPCFTDRVFLDDLRVLRSLPSLDV